MSRRAGIDEITRRNVELISKLESSAINGRTFAERIADIATATIGSWMFLIIQSVLIALWIAVNLVNLWKPWDPYPFILLNLVLSFQSAFATPMILMSQNRQAQLSDRRNQLDLQINLLAEQENTEQLQMLRLLCEHAGIKVPHANERAFEQAVHPDALIRQIMEGPNAVNSESRQVKR